MNLYDEISRYAISVLPHIPATEPVREPLTSIQGAVRMDVTNVFQYIASLEEKERERVVIQDLPNVLPPFPTMWLEFDAGSYAHTDIASFFRKQGISRYGILMLTEDLWDREGGPEGARSIVSDLMRRGGRSVDLDRDVRWVSITYQMTMGPQEPRLRILPYTRVLLIDEEGQFARNRETGDAVFIAQPFHNKFRDALLAEDDFRHMNRHTHLAPMFALSLMHCKNVEMVEKEDVRSRQQRRRDTRDGVQRAVMYTLKIDAMKRTLKTEGGAERHGLKKALHICRGHFAHYSEDKPLFGKYSGRFWKPAHVRGTQDAGIVGKDYQVDPEATP